MSKDDYVKPPQSRRDDYVLPNNNDSYVKPPQSNEDEYVSPNNNNTYVKPPQNNGGDYVLPNNNSSANKTNQKNISETQNEFNDFQDNPNNGTTFSGKIKNIFRNINKDWLKRHYIFSVVIYVLIISVLPTLTIKGDLFFILSALFYPYSMFIYESVRNFLLGDNNVGILFSMKSFFIWKLVKIFVMWLLSIPIGLLGLIILYFKVNK